MHRLLSLLLITSSLASAQTTPRSQPAPITLERPYHLTLLTPRECIHASEQTLPLDTPVSVAPGLLRRDTRSSFQVQSDTLARADANRIFDNFQAVHLDVILDPTGHVESAHALSGPKQFFARAEAIETRRIYQPVLLNGQPVRARFDDFVSIYPLEQWSATPTAFPTHLDSSNILIRLDRTSCFGSCPAYTVTLTGTGNITFSTDDTSLAVPGRHTAHIPPSAILALLQQFRQANFLSALDVYRCSWTDLPTNTLTLSVGSLHKQVIDYGGQLVGLPSAVANLEDVIDTATATARWIRGTPLTAPSLLAERWDFAASTPANLALYDSAIQHPTTGLLPLFVAAHAPLISTEPRLRSPICLASEEADLALVQQMLATRTPNTQLDPAALTECLSAAARSGSLAMLNLWIDNGARPAAAYPVPQPLYQTASFLKVRSPVLDAIDSGSPDILARLLSLHPGLTPGANNGIDPLTEAKTAGCTLCIPLLRQATPIPE